MGNTLSVPALRVVTASFVVLLQGVAAAQAPPAGTATNGAPFPNQAPQPAAAPTSADTAPTGVGPSPPGPPAGPAHAPSAGAYGTPPPPAGGYAVPGYGPSGYAPPQAAGAGSGSGYGQSGYPPPPGYAGGAAGPIGAPPPPGYGPSPQYSLPPRSWPEATTPWTPSQPGVVVALERVVSLGGANLSADNRPSTSGTTFSVAGTGGIGSIGTIDDPFTAPALSFHGVVGHGLTLGIGVGFLSGSLNGPSNSSDSLSWTSLIVSPRIGYMATLGPHVALWAKAGITYAHETISVPDTTTSCDASGCTQSTSTSDIGLSFLELSIDPMFVFFPIPHVGILVGPAVDIGLSSSASASSGTSSSDVAKITNYGLTAGLAAFF